MNTVSNAEQIWFMPHAFHRVFPVTFSTTSQNIVWTDIAYPYLKPTFSSVTAAVIGIATPLTLIVLSQIWVRSFCDLANALTGLTYSLSTGTFVNMVLKKTIGGLRPHFLSVCEPIVPPRTMGQGYKNIMFTIEQVCRGKDKRKIGNAIESFPSGHSECAFAGLFYLSIYLFTHLDIQSRSPVSHWRMVACVLPTLLATYIACTVVLEYHHHAYDAIFGALLGIVMALFGYRMVFRSIWNSGLNTTPSCHPECGEHGKPEEGSLPR